MNTLTTYEKRTICPSLGINGTNLNNFLLDQNRKQRTEKNKDKIINKLNTEIFELKSKLSKSKNERLITGLKKEVNHNPHIGGSTLLNTKRLINFTEIGKEYTKSDFQRELNIPTTAISEILMFLAKYSNVKFEENIRKRLVRIQ